LTTPNTTPSPDNEEDVYNDPASVLLRSLSGSAKIIVDVWARAHRPPPPDANLVTDLLNVIVHGIQTGEDFSGTYPTIARLVNNQEHRAKLVDQLTLVDDYRRAAAFIELRNELETELISAARNNLLHPSERLVLLKMTDDRLKDIQNRISGSAVDIQDVLSLLQKANYAVEMKGDALKKKFITTSPQGREIIRKLVTTMGRRLKSDEKKGDGLP
jgi:hypothetical protein